MSAGGQLSTCEYHCFTNRQWLAWFPDVFPLWLTTTLNNAINTLVRISLNQSLYQIPVYLSTNQMEIAKNVCKTVSKPTSYYGSLAQCMICYTFYPTSSSGYTDLCSVCRVDISRILLSPEDRTGSNFKSGTSR
jgi:hypothetical protein